MLKLRKLQYEEEKASALLKSLAKIKDEIDGAIKNSNGGVSLSTRGQSFYRVLSHDINELKKIRKSLGEERKEALADAFEKTNRFAEAKRRVNALESGIERYPDTLEYNFMECKIDINVTKHNKNN